MVCMTNLKIISGDMNTTIGQENTGKQNKAAKGMIIRGHYLNIKIYIKQC